MLLCSVSYLTWCQLSLNIQWMIPRILTLTLQCFSIQQNILLKTFYYLTTEGSNTDLISTQLIQIIDWFSEHMWKKHNFGENKNFFFFIMNLGVLRKYVKVMSFILVHLLKKFLIPLIVSSICPSLCPVWLVWYFEGILPQYKLSVSTVLAWSALCL